MKVVIELIRVRLDLDIVTTLRQSIFKKYREGRLDALDSEARALWIL